VTGSLRRGCEGSEYELDFLLTLLQEQLVEQDGSRDGFDPDFYLTGVKIKPKGQNKIVGFLKTKLN
jgi:hypothetical protein